MSSEFTFEMNKVVSGFYPSVNHFLSITIDTETLTTAFNFLLKNLTETYVKLDISTQSSNQFYVFHYKQIFYIIEMNDNKFIGYCLLFPFLQLFI